MNPAALEGRRRAVSRLYLDEPDQRAWTEPISPARG
jgi:hypothetical protein